MSEQILKTGRGLLHGISNPLEQPGKRLTCYDGETVLCTLKLDKAFPGYVETLEDGTEGREEPGILLDIPFMTNLRIQTDGDDLETLVIIGTDFIQAYFDRHSEQGTLTTADVDDWLDMMQRNESLQNS